MAGWIKLYRTLMDWEWYDDHNTTRLFIHLLIDCNHETKSWKGVQVNPGQTITGRKILAAETGISEQSLRTSLANLQSTSEITIKSTKHYSVITICNWDKYQANQPSNQPPTNQLTNQQLTTTKEDKKKRSSPLPPEGDKYPALFAMFPTKRKGSYDNGLKAWLKAIVRDSQDSILFGARLYAVSVEATKNNGEFASGLAKWLNDDGWRKQWTPPDTQKIGFARAGLV